MILYRKIRDRIRDAQNRLFVLYYILYIISMSAVKYMYKMCIKGSQKKI